LSLQVDRSFNLQVGRSWQVGFATWLKSCDFNLQVEERWQVRLHWQVDGKFQLASSKKLANGVCKVLEESFNLQLVKPTKLGGRKLRKLLAVGKLPVSWQLGKLQKKVVKLVSWGGRGSKKIICIII
jgi:hypothetical protein